MRILVLDDEPTVIKAVSRILRDHDVDGATDAQTAVDMVQKTQYDVIFVDYKMPEHDGIWFMKNAKLKRDTKALLLTGYLENNMLKEMFKHGIAGYLVKPFRAEDIRHHIEYHTGDAAVAVG